MGQIATTAYPPQEITPDEARAAILRVTADAQHAEFVRTVVVAQAVRHLGAGGMSLRGIAAELELSKSTVDRILRAGSIGWSLGADRDQVEKLIAVAWADTTGEQS